MAYFQLISCKIKFQLCVGHFPDGRMRTRTFGIGGVRADVGADDVAAVARAIAPLLAYPVVRVRLVRKFLLVTDRVVGAHTMRPPDETPQNADDARISGDIPVGDVSPLSRHDARGRMVCAPTARKRRNSLTRSDRAYKIFARRVT